MPSIALPTSRWRPRLARLARAAVAAAALCAGVAQAQFLTIPLGGPKPVKPSPNRTQLGAPVDLAAAVASPSRSPAMVRRDASEHPAEVLAVIAPTYGARVVVIEAVTAYWGELVAAALGNSGRVVEVVAPAEAADAGRRAERSDLIARLPMLTPTAAPRLPPGGSDLVVVDRTYGRRAAAAPAAIFAALRPGGSVVVIDYAGGVGATDPARRDAHVVATEFARAGFVLDSESAALRNPADDHRGAVADLDDPADRFVLRFRKPEE